MVIALKKTNRINSYMALHLPHDQCWAQQLRSAVATNNGSNGCIGADRTGRDPRLPRVWATVSSTTSRGASFGPVNNAINYRYTYRHQWYALVNTRLRNTRNTWRPIVRAESNWRYIDRQCINGLSVMPTNYLSIGSTDSDDALNHVVTCRFLTDSIRYSIGDSQ